MTSHRKLLFLAVVALFTLLGSRGFVEPDEGRYAGIGREMAATDEWLVPHLNGFPHFQKPPLLYWATAASIRLFGANEWAVRLPSAVAALGVVLLTAMIGQRLSGGKLVSRGRLFCSPPLAFSAWPGCSHGLEFYLRRLVSATEEQSDTVLQPTSTERRRLISSSHFKSRTIEPKSGEPPVFILTRTGRARKSFPPERWVTHGTAGDFILLKSRISALAHERPVP